MNYSEYISQYKGRKGYLLRVHDNSIYEFAIGHSGLLRGNYLIQEVGNDFVILAKNRDNTFWLCLLLLCYVNRIVLNTTPI